MHRTRARLILGWVLLIGSVLGLVVCLPAWWLNVISSRAMLGVTLALSWLALTLEAWNILQVAADRHADT